MHCSGASRSWRAALLCRRENISQPRSKRTEKELGVPHYVARYFRQKNTYKGRDCAVVGYFESDGRLNQ
jgi:hypothetical protein